MKKILLTAMIASLLVFPFGTVALAETQEASAAPTDQACYVPGEVPAETGAVESMAPAIHAVILSMLNHDAAVFDGRDESVSWEALYNMLSLYGQMDDRSEYRGETLVLQSETVRDYAAALSSGSMALEQLPASLADRMRYQKASDSLLLTCGNDSLAEAQLGSVVKVNGSLHVTGSLVYLVDGSDLASFQATLAPQDNMFGYTITSLALL